MPTFEKIGFKSNMALKGKLMNQAQSKEERKLPK